MSETRVALVTGANKGMVFAQKGDCDVSAAEPLSHGS